MKPRFPIFYYLASTLKFGMLGWVLVGFSACNKVKTTDLLPDSCTGIIAINIPSLLPKLLKNQPVIDSISHVVGLQIDKIGLNYFEPAYFFQKRTNGLNSYYFLIGLDDEKEFTIRLAEKFQDADIEEHNGFRSVAIAPIHFVWNDEFLIGQYFDPMIGRTPDSDQLAAMIQSPPNSKNLEVVSDSADFSFFWSVNESAPNLQLPPLEMIIKGSAMWISDQFRLKAQLEEHQYLALLKPFKFHNLYPPNEAGIRFLVWPALESILLQISGYGGNAFPNEMNKNIIDLLSKLDHPFEIYYPENGTGILLHDLQIKARFKDEMNAGLLENEINKMLPNSLLSDYKVAKFKGEIVFFHKSAKPYFEFEKLNPDSKTNSILGLVQSNPQTKTQFTIETKGGGHYVVDAQLDHPERLQSNSVFSQARSVKADSIVHHFLP